MFRLFMLCVVLLIVSVQSFTLKSSRFLSSSSSTKKFLFGNPEPPKQSPEAQKKDGGLFGGMGNIMDSMKKAQEIAKQAQELNKELAGTAFVGNDPQNLVTATFNGLGAPISIKVSEGILSQGADSVSKATTDAMMDAYAKAQTAMMTKMQNMYAGGMK